MASPHCSTDLVPRMPRCPGIFCHPIATGVASARHQKAADSDTYERSAVLPGAPGCGHTESITGRT